MEGVESYRVTPMAGFAILRPNTLEAKLRPSDRRGREKGIYRN